MLDTNDHTATKRRVIDDEPVMGPNDSVTGHVYLRVTDISPGIKFYTRLVSGLLAN